MSEIMSNSNQILSLKQEAELFPIREEHREKITKKVLAENGISKRRDIPTYEQMKWEKRIIDEGLTIENYKSMFDAGLPEKMIIQIAFGGNRGDYLEFKKLVAEQDYKKELKLVYRGEHPLFVEKEDVINFYMFDETSEMDAKEAHANTHAPMLASHVSKGGTKTSYSPRSEFQDILNDLDKKRITAPVFSIKTLQSYLQDEYGLISPKILKNLVKEINQGVLEFEAKIINSSNQNIMEKEALDEISKYCMSHNNDTFEKSNKLGEDAIQMIKKLEPEFGKAIGKKIAQTSDQDAEESISSLAKTVVNTGCKIYNKPAEEMVPFVVNTLMKMIGK